MSDTTAESGGTERGVGMLHRVLRTPLLTKLVLLDLSVNVLVLVFLQLVPRHLTDEVTVISLLLVLVLNAGLVAWALKPLAILEATARKVSGGAWDARAVMPAMADRNLVRIAETFNTLLDNSAAERARVRTLAVRVVDADDRERSRIARELHDGTAQALSALDMLLSTTSSEWSAELARENLQIMRDITAEALESVRLLSQTVHPRVLDDLGLAAALRMLVKRALVHPGIKVEVNNKIEALEVSPLVAATIYRIAQEALHNAAKHAGSGIVIEVDLDRVADEIHLCVRDNGLGFTPPDAVERRSGMGLFIMEERCVLVDARLSVVSSPGNGTTVEVWVPLGQEIS